MPPPSGSSPLYRLSILKFSILLLAFSIASYLLGPPLYWHFFEGIAALKHNAAGSSCPPCSCDCSADSGVVLPPELSNHSIDCSKTDPSLQEELGKYPVDLLSEELKLQERVADENQQRADSALLEVKKMSSQYQKEAEKCNFGMETCEEAREKAEAALTAEKKLTKLWEDRARELGWKKDE